jgi:hypothetical protein
MSRFPALALLLCAAPALGGEKLAVAELHTAPALTGMGAQVARAVGDAAEALGFTVLTPDDVRESLGSALSSDLRGCEADPDCAGQRLRKTGATRGVVGSLMRDEKSYLIKLWFMDLSKMQILATVDRRILIASRRFTPDVNEALPRLLRGEKEATGKVNFTADAPGVVLEVDGVEVGQAPLVVELKPGKHRVRGRKRGFETVERYFTTLADGTHDEPLRMIRRMDEMSAEDITSANGL